MKTIDRKAETTFLAIFLALVVGSVISLVCYLTGVDSPMELLR